MKSEKLKALSGHDSHNTSESLQHIYTDLSVCMVKRANRRNCGFDLNNSLCVKESIDRGRILFSIRYVVICQATTERREVSVENVVETEYIIPLKE